MVMMKVPEGPARCSFPCRQGNSKVVAISVFLIFQVLKL